MLGESKNNLLGLGKMRETGIDILGKVPWGTHFCQFYQTQEELLDILVPYFFQGIISNEYCMWITSEPLSKDQAIEALRRKMPDLGECIAKGQIEVLDFAQWYTVEGKFEADRVVNGWMERETQALKNGYDGLRLSGNTFWLERQDWEDFVNYEAKINDILNQHKIVALCTYSLNRCGPFDLLDVVKNHQFALVKRDNTWVMLESAQHRKKDEALRESERRYRGLVETIEAGFIHCQIVKNEDGRPIDFIFKDINPAYERMRNLRRTEIIGKRVSEVFPKIAEDPYDWIGKYGRVALTGEPFQYEHFSQVTNVFLKGYVYSPEPGFFDVLFFDITERKNAEQALIESEEKFRSIVEATPIGIHMWEIAPDGRLVFAGANPAADKILGIQHQAHIGKNVPEVFPTHAHTNVAEIYLKIAREGGTWSENQYTYKDDQITGIYEVIAFQTAPGRMIAMFSDITERLRVEEEIKQKNEDLLRSNRDLETFTFVAAHDLQEPLRMVSNYVQLLSDRYHDKIDPEAEVYIQQVIDNTSTMHILVKGLLEYSQLRNQIKPPDIIDMNVILKQALSHLKVVIKGSSATISYDPLPKLRGDCTQLVEVFRILLDNGLKFRKDQEPPKIHIGMIPQDGKEWHIFVRDNGIGIDPKYFPKLFILFRRLHPRGKYPGTGVGLAICKKIVERHGGRIWGESELGKGSTFHFTLPKTLP
ncbi:MAG: putative signal transduction histidine kinase [Promethearchaeota archaeon CR_4]|nr:MAG: putative signal transduction histidine kinase [Candidatus Lokiarchaeota archaeon CR_4]